MFLAALLDLGAPLEAAQAAIDDLSLKEPVSLSSTQVDKRGIRATALRIQEGATSSSHVSGHHHHGPARCLPDLLKLLDGSPLSESVRSRAATVFKRLAEAEGKIHGKSPNEVHFHEVSGVDTIVDVVGTCVALEALQVSTVSTGPVATGSGFVDCAHGRLPLPAPATLEMLTGIPTVPQAIEAELTTPTGAALLSTLATTVGVQPAMTVQRVGYGAGTRDLPDRSNTLRLQLGVLSRCQRHNQVCQLTCNLDDTTGETISYTIERLLQAGALDAYARPLQMKKGRPGVELIALAEPSRKAALADLIFRETTTFGLRVEEVNRMVLDREFHQVTIDGHPIRVKVGRLGGEVTTLAAEYEDCAAAARALEQPLKELQARAEQLTRDTLSTPSEPGDKASQASQACYFSQDSNRNALS
jgi:uncharacterized protein (TIGR00299 family) protein